MNWNRLSGKFVSIVVIGRTLTKNHFCTAQQPPPVYLKPWRLERSRYNKYPGKKKKKTAHTDWSSSLRSYEIHSIFHLHAAGNQQTDRNSATTRQPSHDSHASVASGLFRAKNRRRATLELSSVRELRFLFLLIVHKRIEGSFTFFFSRRETPSP